jgi:hypothetical protein
MRTLIFAGIILASSAALAQSPAQKALGMGCYEFYLDLDRCFRYDAVACGWEWTPRYIVRDRDRL